MSVNATKLNSARLWNVPLGGTRYPLGHEKWSSLGERLRSPRFGKNTHATRGISHFGNRTEPNLERPSMLGSSAPRAGEDGPKLPLSGQTICPGSDFKNRHSLRVRNPTSSIKVRHASTLPLRLFFPSHVIDARFLARRDR